MADSKEKKKRPMNRKSHTISRAQRGRIEESRHSGLGTLLLLSLLPAITVVGLIVAAVVGGKFLGNSLFMAAYSRGKMLPALEKAVSFPGYPENYVPYYNLGNVEYRKGNYEAAQADYAKALGYEIESGRECPVRINYALSVLAQVSEEDYQAALGGDAQKKAAVVGKLRTARGILTEKGCAGAADDNGHSPEAEQLKKEIDEYLKKLGADQNGDQESQEDQGDSGNEQSGGEDDSESQSSSGPSHREQQLEKNLNERKQEAAKERQSTQDEYRGQGIAPGMNESGENGGNGGESGGSDEGSGRSW